MRFSNDLHRAVQYPILANVAYKYQYWMFLHSWSSNAHTREEFMESNK